MTFSDRMMMAILGLTCVIMLGMITSAWRIVLYPLVPLLGISILFGYPQLATTRGRPVWLAVAISTAFGLLFVVLDVMTGGEPTGTAQRVLGMTPPMALYVTAFPILVIVTGLVYGLTFTQEEAAEPEANGVGNIDRASGGDDA